VQATFLATHYAVLSLEKCTLQQDGLSTEDGIYKTATQLKAINPGVKVLMYWGVADQGSQCSKEVQALFAAHPEYFLHDNNGNLVVEDGGPQFDFRQPAVRDWWTVHPFTIGLNASGLIDGILADGAGPRANIKAPLWVNFTAAEIAAINAGAVAVINQTQTKFDAENGGVVLGNGILMYPNKYNPGTPMLPDYNMDILDVIDGIESEHVAAFESRNSRTGALNITRVLKNLDLIDQVRCGALFNSYLHSRMPLSFTPLLLRLQRCHACDQCHL
jgi:hypothetical protein